MHTCVKLHAPFFFYSYTGCDVVWTEEPSLTPSRPINDDECSFINASVTLHCSIEADIRFTLDVAWFHTPDRSLAGRPTVQPISHDDDTDNYFFFAGSSTSSKDEVQSKTYSLLIEGVTVHDYGYWWCKVKVNDMVQRIPSAILLLSPPCEPNPVPCPEPAVLSRSVNPRCALDQEGVLIEPQLPPRPPLCTSVAHTASVHPSPQGSSTPLPAASATPAALPPGENNPVYGYVIVGLIGAAVTSAVVGLIVSIVLCIRKCRKRRGECKKTV